MQEQLIAESDSCSQSWEQLSRDWVQLSCGFIINFCVKKSGKSGKSIFSEIPHKSSRTPMYKGIGRWGTPSEIPHIFPIDSPLSISMCPDHGLNVLGCLAFWPYRHSIRWGGKSFFELKARRTPSPQQSLKASFHFAFGSSILSDYGESVGNLKKGSPPFNPFVHRHSE